MSLISEHGRRSFAANRAVGRVAFRVGAQRGVTRRQATDESGPMRVRFPNPHAHALEAVLVNTAGGIAGGDRLAVDIEAGRGSRLVVSTAAAEKIYRSHGPDAVLSLKLAVRAGAHLCWLPQETILFDRARLMRTIEIDLDAEASLVFAETQVFGRTAMNETIADGAFVDRWRVRRDGKLVFAEQTRLAGDIGAKLAQPAIGGGAVAVATLLIAPGTDAAVEAFRACDGLKGQAAISMWNGIAVARFCANDAAALRHDLALQLAALRLELPRLWLQ